MTKYKQAKPVFKTGVQTKAVEPVKSKFDWLATVFKLSALFVLGIYLYGYGAVVGYAGYFGIPQSALFSSSSDLLGIASETLLHHTLYFFNTGGVFGYLWLILKSTFNTVLLYGLLVACVWFAIITIGKSKRARDYLRSVLCSIFPEAKIQLSESVFKSFIRSIWHGILFVIASLTGQIAIICILFLVFTLFLTAAVFGYYAAVNHAGLDIIRPKKCDAIQTNAQFIDTLEKQKAAKLAVTALVPAEHTANCIKVTYSDTKGSKTIAGRSVLAGSDYVLVYELNGKTTRIPLKTAVIETADDAVLKEVELQNAKLLLKDTQ